MKSQLQFYKCCILSRLYEFNSTSSPDAYMNTWVLSVFKTTDEDLVIQSLVLIHCCEVFIFCTLRYFCGFHTGLMQIIVQPWTEKWKAQMWLAQNQLRLGGNTAVAAQSSRDGRWLRALCCTPCHRGCSGAQPLSLAAHMHSVLSASAQLLNHWTAVTWVVLCCSAKNVNERAVANVL